MFYKSTNKHKNQECFIKSDKVARALRRGVLFGLVQKGDFKMKLFAVFGNPVTHSKSPSMHNRALLSLGERGCYKKIKAECAQDIVDSIKTLRLDGANITVPFKEEIVPFLDEIDPFAKLANAVNTIVHKDGRLKGYNTDAEGFFRCLPASLKRVLILGAGGSAKAIALFLKQKGLSVTVLNRSEFRRDFFDSCGIGFFTPSTFVYDEAYEAIINSSASSLEGKLPFEDILESLLSEKPYCIDIMYGKPSPFLELAKTYGCMTKDGKEMLINQGVLAFMHFFDQKYSFEELVGLFEQGFMLAE